MRPFPLTPSWSILAAATLLGLSLPADLSAGEKKDLENKILEQQQKMHRLHKGIEEQKNRIYQTHQQEVGVLTELERIETRLATERKRLLALRRKLTNQEQQIETTKTKLDSLLREQEELQAQVKQRLAAYYRTGKLGMLNALFSANSLPELLKLEEYFRHLFRHDRQVIQRYRQSIATVAEARRDLERQKNELNVVLAGVKQQELETSALQQEKMALLQSVRTEKKLYQRAVEELEQAAARLTATFADLREEAAGDDPPAKSRRAGPPGTSIGFSGQKGHLPPPVAGTVVTRFGQEVEGKFGITRQANGIDIKTEAGAQIKAVAGGTIIYSGYLRGYGNLLIIDHGQQYYSLMSRGGRFFKKKKEIVRKGEVVGLMGEGDAPLSEGLHFEIRHGANPLDPLMWLDQQDPDLAIEFAEHDQSAPLPSS